MNKRFEELPLQKWVWIELTGFDNASPDFGVSSFIGRAGFTPDGVTLLLYWTGFALNHKGLDVERPLSIVESSYGGHEYCPERRRQDWTNWQLKGLIDELHRAGSKAYMSFFNMSAYTDDEGRRVKCDFYNGRDYLNETNRKGEPAGGVCMLKRLEDGCYYEDALQTAAVRALVDYGFDGMQIADGISSPRVALQEGDYSPDMLDQFYDYTGIRAPEGEEAADWIWREKRMEWIRFNCDRWDAFYKKFARRLREAGKEGIFNSAWTREPFEAMYRYGVDYRRVAASGLDGCMVEDVSAGMAILSELDNGYLMNDEQRRRVRYEYLTVLMLNRAAMPALRVTPLAGVHDTMEQWGVLEHMPTSMTANVMGNLNAWQWTATGLRPVTDGPYFCLSDSLAASDWAFIKKQWELGATETPTALAGATALWSDARLDRELEAFCDSRLTPTHKLISELLYAGAPVPAVARVEDLSRVRGALLVTNPALLPEDELRAALSYSGGPVILIGAGARRTGFEPLVEEKNSFAPIALCAREAEGRAVIDNSASYNFDPKTSMEPVRAQWTRPLDFAPISADFYIACAEAIVAVTRAPKLKAEGRSELGVRRRVCKYACAYIGDKRAKVIIFNDDYYYNHPTIDFGRAVKGVTCVTKYFGYKVSRQATGFTSRVPGRGAEAFEVEFE